jgi:2-polyprenyl-3-methyl-5-hydroxy-6-metoxy-1,4-benzoquinol methylase
MNEEAPVLRWSQGRLENAYLCPMCHAGSRYLVGDAQDNMVPQDDHWSVWRCAACDSRWLDPRPDNVSLPAAYDFDYITHDAPATQARAGWLTSLINGYLKYRFNLSGPAPSAWGVPFFFALPPLRLKLDYYGRHVRPIPGGKLLDVGCGNGAFVSIASAMGWSAEGVDPDAEAIAACELRGIPVTHGFVHDLPSIKKSSYWDVVTMSHCLEHVADPGALLSEAFTMLVPGGHLWIALPNPAAVGARAYGMDWESIDAPRHLVLPSKKALIRACRDTGFDVVTARRRGAHTARLYRRSAEIARGRGKRGFRYSPLAGTLLSLISDLLATFTTRYADEMVILARKPRATLP